MEGDRSERWISGRVRSEASYHRSSGFVTCKAESVFPCPKVMEDVNAAVPSISAASSPGYP